MLRAAQSLFWLGVIVMVVKVIANFFGLLRPYGDSIPVVSIEVRAVARIPPLVPLFEHW